MNNKTEESIAEMYKRIEAEILLRSTAKRNKTYSADDLRAKIKEIFEAVETTEMPTSVLVKMVKSFEGFEETKYQEIRSVVQGKRFVEASLETTEAGVSMVKVI